MTALLDPDTIDKLVRHTDDLAIIADWKDELIARIDRAQMYLELVGLDHAEQDCPSSKYLRPLSVFNKRDSGSSLVSI